jgi:hypothetical protein
MVEETGQQLHLPPGSGLPIGLAEAVILALYLWPRTAVLGAVLIAALMGGTAGVHLVNGNPWPSHILFGPYLAVFAWSTATGGFVPEHPEQKRLRSSLPSVPVTVGTNTTGIHVPDEGWRRWDQPQAGGEGHPERLPIATPSR